MRRNKIKKKYLDLIYPSSKVSQIDQNMVMKSNESDSLPDKEMSFWERVEKKVIYGLIALGLLLLYTFKDVIAIIGMLVLGFNLETMSTSVQIIFYLVVDVLILLFFIWVYRKDFLANFKSYFGKGFGKRFRQSLLFWIGGLMIMMISNYCISLLRDGAIANNEESVRSLIDLAPWYMGFEIIILAPILEELIFRKSIRNVFHNKYLYIFMSGFIFGGMHVFLSMTSALDLLYLIPYGALGIVFACLYQKTDNIFSTITIHSFHNTLAFLLYVVTL